ncbi:hypothetical protein ACQKC9_12345 [Psychrobacter sp. NPDC078409]|uniref:hypothetical protein n=1 Tax=Psychrobacter sp. NPDC078409 TaxID=3390660 RepID=UPI003CFCFCDB
MAGVEHRGVFNLEVINNNKKFWIQLFKNIENSPTIEPKRALKEITSLDINIPFNLNNDEVESIYLELKKDFIWLEFFYCKINEGLRNSLTDSEFFELKGLCKWIIDKINNWKLDSDPNLKIISLCFLVINLFNINIWFYLKDKINNIEIENELSLRVIKFKSNVKCYESSLIWEKEAIQKIDIFIKNRDWLGIANNWSIFRNSKIFAFPNIFQSQCFLLLNELCLDKLTRSLERYEDYFSMMSLVNNELYLLDSRFLLASKTNNDLLKFALLFDLELKNHINLSNEQEVVLAGIFANICKNKELAKIWFEILNRYLVRFYFFSGAFGIFIAKHASEEDINIYLNSLGNSRFGQTLSYNYSDDRRILTEVFERFDSLASLEKRKILWHIVYSKYIEHGLSNYDGTDYMNNLCYSVFDYAVVSYFLECVNISNLESKLAQINQELTDIHSNWTNSEIDLRSKFYKLISLLQPIYHTNLVLEAKVEKLQKVGSYYVPPQLVNDKRTGLMFDFTLDG